MATGFRGDAGSTAAMSTPVIPVSWGEYLDRMTILAIKAHRLEKPAARANVMQEQERLRQAVSHPNGVEALEAALLAVNTRLWRIEDLIRTREAAEDFGPGFIALARAVYRENDERGRIKQSINRMLQSDLVEEKQYPAYDRHVATGKPTMNKSI
jgi:hypothetical protein